MKRKLLVLLLLSMCSAAASAGDLEIALNQDAAQLGYKTGFGTGNFDFGVFFNEDDDLLGSVGLTVAGVPAGETPLTFALGTRLYAATLDIPDADVLALSLGGQVRYTIPSNMPMHLLAGVFYAPDITTFNDADEFLDFVVRFEVEFVPRTSGFIGYRLLEADTDSQGSHELDDNLHVGISLHF